MSTSKHFAFVTLVTSDDYLPGALVVAAALREAHSSPPVHPDELDPSEFDRVCLVTPETVDVSTIKLLRRAFDVVVGVEVIEERTEEGLKLLGRPDLKTVLTKLHVFRLTSYRKIIFLDADVLTLRPISHLFRFSASFAAVPDVGWPDIFNSGFLLLEPGEDKFEKVMELVKSKGSWDGGDQGVLNEWVGQDWERLSFTYNTTPTAAYTYAPAYKRFGSQISNIHFIGPNKPWSQIAVRSPGTTSSTSSPTAVPSQEFTPPPSYAYPALLDRWFAVYDKYYRAPDAPEAFQPNSTLSEASLSTSAGEFTVQRYESAWDSDMRPSLGADVSGVGAPMGLEELRRTAIEGGGQSAASAGDGAYRSLPLEGRLDLMRPQQPQPIEDEEPAHRAVRILVPETPETPPRSFTPMSTLPTPGPNEFPPTPVFRGHSLPPETPTHARAESLLPVTQDHKYFEPLPGNRSLPRPSSPARPASSPQRPTSPPLLIWNPAVEAPPTVQPPPSHFPEETYYPNVWDTHTQDQHVPEESGGFFPLPPPASIPDRLIREGHYRDVIGESGKGEQETEKQQPPQQHHEHEPPQPHHVYLPAQQPSHPQPDRSKVAPVFPWEEKPRHAPERFFPRTDSPPPGQPFIEARPPTLKIDISSPQTFASLPSASPPGQRGFPRASTYANAWDAVPSIQRYAARLARPAPAPVSTPVSAIWAPGGGRKRKGSAATAGGDEYRSWEDKAEVSSRDADDEDDEEDDEEDPSPPSVGAESDRSEGLAERPPRAEKVYKGKGIQTVPREMRHQAVQVQSGNGRRAARSGTRTGGHRNQQQQHRSSSDDDRPSRTSQSGALSPRLHDAYTFSSTERRGSVQSAIQKDSASHVPELSPPVAESRATATDPTFAVDQAASPPSSLGPSSPPEGAPVFPGPQPTPAPIPRPAGRTFDPARGVDVFKKGSEEVLARFLKMSSWEEDSPAGPGSPSAA